MNIDCSFMDVYGSTSAVQATVLHLNFDFRHEFV